MVSGKRQIYCLFNSGSKFFPNTSGGEGTTKYQSSGEVLVGCYASSWVFRKVIKKKLCAKKI